MTKYLSIVAILASMSLSAIAANSDQQQLLKDCEHEARAVGFTGADVDSYIIECVKEFEETEIVNTKLGPKK